MSILIYLHLAIEQGVHVKKKKIALKIDSTKWLWLWFLWSLSKMKKVIDFIINKYTPRPLVLAQHFVLYSVAFFFFFLFFFFFEKQTSKFQKINIGIWNIQNFPEFLHTIFGVWQFHYWFSHLLQHQTLLLILIQQLRSPNWSYRGYFSCFYLNILFLEQALFLLKFRKIMKK